MKKRVDSKDKMLAITGANIVDVLNRTIHMNYSLLCRNGRIVEMSETPSIAIPKGAELISLSGQFIIPGLIDAHVHLAHPGVDDYGRLSFESMTKKYKRNSYLTLKSGVTTIRNMPGASGYRITKFRDNVKKGKFLGPRIFASGPALSAPYGYFSLKRFIPAPLALLKVLSVIFGAHGLSIDVNSTQEISDAITKLKLSGVDFIKTTTPGKECNDPESREYYIKRKVNPQILDASMKIELLQDIVEIAHIQGLKVSAHTINLPSGFKQAVEAGIDSIEHTPLGLLDDETFALMRSNGTYWVPTAFCFYNWKRLVDDPELFSEHEIRNAIPEPYHSMGKKALYKMNQAIKSGMDPIWEYLYAEMPNYEQIYFPTNFANAMKYGVKIVAGTDAGMGGAGYVPHGFLYKELEMFVNNGMDAFEAIKTATINAAELLGVEDEIGSIELDKVADLVVIQANPIENITNIQQIQYVIKEGKIVYRDS